MKWELTARMCISVPVTKNGSHTASAARITTFAAWEVAARAADRGVHANPSAKGSTTHSCTRRYAGDWHWCSLSSVEAKTVTATCNRVSVDRLNSAPCAPSRAPAQETAKSPNCVAILSASCGPLPSYAEPTEIQNNADTVTTHDLPTKWYTRSLREVRETSRRAAVANARNGVRHKARRMLPVDATSFSNQAMRPFSNSASTARRRNAIIA